MSVSGRQRAAALLGAALLAACSAGDSASTADADTSGSHTRPAAAVAEPEPREGELLLANPPEGWRETAAMRTPTLRMAEYGPPEERSGELERLTFEAQSGQPLPDPIDFVQAVSRGLRARCKGYQDINVSSGVENGYPTSVRLMICPEFRDSPRGQVVMAKAIQGAERFYVVTRRLQVPPIEDGQPLTAQAMAEWTTHLKGVRLCDTRDPERPCPDPAHHRMSAPAHPPWANGT